MEYLQYLGFTVFVTFKGLKVLNLIINGIPSIRCYSFDWKFSGWVLNLIINGIPSIQPGEALESFIPDCFKPYYKWNTFNTKELKQAIKNGYKVLNLIINGIPSIRLDAYAVPEL